MARWNRFVAFVCFLLCLQLAVGHVLIPVRRQDTGSSASVTSAIRSATTRDGGATSSPVPSVGSTSATVTNTAPLSGTITSSSVVPTSSDGSNPFYNSTLFNTTIPEGQLPLEPKTTPGWAVAGVVLMFAGIFYLLIGIKNPIWHNTLSVAFVVGLGVTVLIVYLMPVPVSNGSQGGYVAGAILSGILVGVGATWFFNEITECFASALGGFCLSMWLLCVSEGGLLSGISKVIFIIVLTFAAFATYFTRWTRDWSLIISISFTGATATVMGIDCFSRAGLKEFWAYVWRLNDNLFPLGADTYPLAKGIRVELAAVIVLFCIGIISQKRLWNVIKDHRAKRQEELAEQRRARDEEEANIGRHVEAETARERRMWERVHGDHDSGFARDSESEKGIRYSQSNAAVAGPQPLLVAEMQGCEVPPVPSKTTSLVLTGTDKEKNAVVSVRPALDGAVDATPEHNGEKGFTDQTSETNNQHSREAAVPPVPEVIPLPFKFPVLEDNTPGNRASTVATFADDDEEEGGTASKRSSFAKRLSQSSVNMMRRVSQHTAMSRQENGPNEEELMVLRRERDDDNGSVAATIDTGKDSRASSFEGDRQSIQVNAQLATDEMTTEKLSATPTPTQSTHLQQGVGHEDSSKHMSTAETLAADIQSQDVTEKAAASDTATDTAQPVKHADQGVIEEESQQPAARSKKAKSTASVESTPVSLTMERLPPGFSDVALHYRTNEWAKHLSHAEAPMAESLPNVGYPEDKMQQEEVAAPLNVEELKQTALTATPAPIPTPSPAPIPTPSPAPVSTPSPVPMHFSMPGRPTSNYVPSRGHSRNNSWQSAPGFENQVVPPVMSRQPLVNHRRVSSKTQIPTVQTIAEESIHAPSRAASINSSSSERMSMAASPAVAPGFERPPPPPGVTSYDSPQSLLAQRSVTLRNKTYGILTGANTMPEFPAPTQRAPSESGSMYNYAPYSSQVQPVSLDDLPLSQRKELIRRQSSLGTMRSSVGEQRSASGPYTPTMSSENVTFDSHQPLRYSTVPSQDAREARLASFRNSVRADLRAGMAVAPSAANGRDTAMMYRTSSSTNLAAQAAAREADMQRNIDLQRSFLMSQKEAEAKRRDKERAEKARVNQAFTSRMQSGEMFELHRDMMRKMQNNVRNE